MSTPSQLTAQLELDLRAPLNSLPQLWTPDDIWRNCDEKVIRSFNEDSRVERKSPGIQQRLLAEYVSMWANTQPFGGITFIGIADDGTLSGCKNIETAHLNDLEAVRALCHDARLECKHVPITNVKGEPDFILAMRVYYREDKLVETQAGEAFVREGDEKRRLTEHEKREIRLNKGEISVESERVPLTYPDDFNIELLNDFRNQYIAKRGLPNRYSIEDVLHLCKLGKSEASKFIPFLNCALLFAKDPRAIVPGSFIRILRYEGTAEEFGQSQNIVADRIVEGPLPLQIGEVQKYIKSQIRNFTRLGKDGKFTTSPEFPEDVWLEAVINAVVHRSYNLKNMNIFVKMFEDKLIVESPGAFLPPTRPDTVFDAHNPRNPNLMWALYYFDRVLCAFEGTRRMRQMMRDASLPDPVFVQKTSGSLQVSVTLQNDAQHRKIYVRSEAAAHIDPDLYSRLSESEKMIVNHLTDNSQINVTDTGKVLAIGWRQSKALLEDLEAKGVLVRSEGKYRSNKKVYSLRRKPLK